MNEIPRNNKVKIFGYRPESPTLKKISASKIKEPLIKDRFEIDVDDSENDNLSNVPIEVVYSHESAHYIIIKGLRIFYEGKQHKKIRKYRCLVVGEVNYDHETITARLAHVFAIVWPFHILEQARAICQTAELFDNTYKHGGNRRGKNYKKQSAIDILCKQFPHKQTRIDDLKRFGKHIGLYGIEGLYHLLIAKKKELSMSLIHHGNPSLRKMKIRAKIDRNVKKMQDKGKDEIEIKQEVAKIIYPIFFEPVKSLEDRVLNNNEKNKGKKKERKNNGENGSNEVEIPPKIYSVQKQDLVEYIGMYEDYIKAENKVLAFLKSNLNSKKCLTKDNTEKLYEMSKVNKKLSSKLTLKLYRLIYKR